MDDKVQEIIKRILEALAERAEVTEQQFDKDSISNVVSQLAVLFKTTGQIKINDSLLEVLSEFKKSTEPLSDLQIIAISKEISPQYLLLNDEQKRLRDLITKEEAAILAESTDVDVNGTQFTYKNLAISQKNIKEAIRTTQLFDDVSLDEILEFSSFLNKYPYLSVTNSIGKKILDECAEIDEKYLTVIDSDIELYRARVMKELDEPFSEQEMRMAPYKVPGQGRFNTQGVSRFYLSERKDDAAREAIKHSTGATKVQVASYKSSAPIRLLDMSKIDNAWSKKCLKAVSNPGPFNVEYLCSGYLAQCIDYYEKIDGIMYGEAGHYLYMIYNDRNFVNGEMQYIDANDIGGDF